MYPTLAWEKIVDQRYSREIGKALGVSSREPPRTKCIVTTYFIATLYGQRGGA